MERVYNNITELVGRTPLLRLNKIKKNIDSNFTSMLASMFFFILFNLNKGVLPTSSVILL